MSALPTTAPVLAVYTHHGLRPDLPFLAGYARRLGLDPTKLTIAHLLHSARRDAFAVAEPLMAYLTGHGDDGTPRFGEETQRVYLQHLKRFARLVVEMRADLFGQSAEAWRALSLRLETPKPNYRSPWTVWYWRCQRCGVDPFAPDNPGKALRDFEEFLVQLGYPTHTYQRYVWTVHSILALLGIMLPPRLPLGSYEAQVEEIVRLLDDDYMHSLAPTTLDSSRKLLTAYARFLIRRQLNSRSAHAPVPPPVPIDGPQP